MLLPREKLIQYGAQSLTDSELLAIFLRTGIKGRPVYQYAQDILTHFGSLYELLSATQEEFYTYKGLGESKYTQLQAVVELSKRVLSTQINHEHLLSSPELTYHYLTSQLSHREREVFMVVFLNNQHRVICAEEMFSGTFNCVDIYPREIIKRALTLNAVALILAHNHPSGMADPSHEDQQITQHIINACELVDIRILDHIIIGKGEYCSFLEKGIL